MNRSSTGIAWTSGLVACVLFAGAVVAGLRPRAEVTLDRFPARASLDYDTTFGRPVAPLREGYVREALGLRRGAPASPAVSAPAPIAAALDPFGVVRLHEEHSFGNDDLDDAHRIERIPFTGRTDARGATREPDEPRDCASEGGTAWYRYRSPTQQDLIANTFGTEYAASLAVYEATDLTLVGCDTDLSGNALVHLISRANTTYLFQITARTTGGGLVFTLEPGGTTELVSEKTTGEPSDWFAQRPSVSADGRFVAFASASTGLTPDAPDRACAVRQGVPAGAGTGTLRNTDPAFPCFQVYLADRARGTMRIVSVSSGGRPGKGSSQAPALSGDGRHVAFVSSAEDLVEADTNGVSDVFVHDTLTGDTDRASVSTDGAQMTPTLDEHPVSAPAISDDGRYVAFASAASNLVGGDTNDIIDVFVRDMIRGTTERVSVSSDEEQGRVPDALRERVRDRIDGSIAPPAMSPDGRYVAFASPMTNLVDGDDNDALDVFVRDRRRGTTEIVSLSSTGEQADAGVVEARPTVSDDGRFVVFASEASSLVDDDTNEVGDAFVRDRFLGTTTRVSVSSTGAEADRPSSEPTISGDGRYVAFSSTATSLDPASRQVPTGDSCGDEIQLIGSCPEDLYVHDLVTGTTVRIPIVPDGAVRASPARFVDLSADGGVLAFVAGFAGCTACVEQVYVHVRSRRSP